MKTPHVQVELAVLWADKTWGDGHFEYVPANQPELAIKAAAVAQLEEKLKDNHLVSMISVYAVDGSGTRYDAAGEPISEEDGTYKNWHVELTAQAAVSCSVNVREITQEKAQETAIDVARTGDKEWKYEGVDDESIEAASVTEMP